MSDWEPMGNHPQDGTPFLIAQFAPTSWEFRVVEVRPPRYMEGEALRATIERQTRYARAWRPSFDPPGPHGTGWADHPTPST